jgi:hypothetical protein
MDADALELRVSRLEAQLRWWRRGGLAALIVAASLVLMGQARPFGKVVEAEKFIVRDSRGRIRAILGPSTSSLKPSEHVIGLEQGLFFYDDDGTYRASLRELDAPGKSWSFEMVGRSTYSSAHLTIGDGISALNLRASDQPKAEADREVEPFIKQFNAAKTGEERLKLMLSQKSNAVSATVSAFPRGTSSLRLSHGLGGSFDMFLTKDRQVSINLTDPKGIDRVSVGNTKLEYPSTGVTEERPLSSVVLFNQDGKVVWKIP